MQVEPEAQVVAPVQPVPPHWPYFVCVGPAALVVAETDVVAAAEVVAAAVVVAAPVVLPVPVPPVLLPVPTEVVMGACSMYTPEK